MPVCRSKMHRNFQSSPNNVVWQKLFHSKSERSPLVIVRKSVAEKVCFLPKKNRRWRSSAWPYYCTGSMISMINELDEKHRREKEKGERKRKDDSLGLGLLFLFKMKTGHFIVRENAREKGRVAFFYLKWKQCGSVAESAKFKLNSSLFLDGTETGSNLIQKHSVTPCQHLLSILRVFEFHTCDFLDRLSHVVFDW